MKPTVPTLVLPLVVVVMLAGCGQTAGRSLGSAGPTGDPAAPAGSAVPSSTPNATPSAAPTATPTATPSADARRRPIEEPVTDDERRKQNQQLIRAAGRGDNAAVSRLLGSGASVTATDRTGRTALVAAAYGNHVAVARRLLAAGADPNAEDETVQSAYLISTSEVGDDPRLLSLLLAEGADVDSLDSWQGTGLIRAAHRGYWRVIGVLLKTPIEVDHINRIGYTALHEAVVLGDGGPTHQRTVAALVEAGVDTSIEDSGGSTALESARARGYDRIAALLD